MTASIDKLCQHIVENPIYPLNQTAARAAMGILKDAAKDSAAIAALLKGDTPLKAFVVSALSLSPYLSDMARVDPGLLEKALYAPLEAELAREIALARAAWQEPPEEATSPETSLMNRLRLAKRRVSFLTALADLSHFFDARQTTLWLSRLAEACASAAVDFLLLSLHESGKLKLVDPASPSRSSGLILLGMGKLGAQELNYSSDIDLVIFFDPSSNIVPDPDEASETFARLARRLVRIMQERTAFGYVFRTDLRLRPDPGSTPLAIPVEAALTYYEGRGQNWERAAFIKARPCAGDIEAGEVFLKELTPFVFRKYLDYAAIADIHSIKRQIHAHKGFGEIAVKGHNVKLGRGGIREIEFFVQTQQLIAGGRMPQLRLRRTEETLQALESARWVDSQTAADLTSAYWFLRNVEHRIQMVNDEQSHILPDSEAELKRIAFMMGFESTRTFSNRLTSVLQTVEAHYAELFEQAAELSGSNGNLVFTGQNDDPDTLATLSQLGFKRPSDIARVIRTWHNGRYRATQSIEARERLTELTPRLLSAFGESARADEAILHFDRFLAGLPAGIQLFSLLTNNPTLLDLIVMIMSAAPRLATIIAARPHIFDGMLDPALLSEIPERRYLAERLRHSLASCQFYEEALDALRIFAAEQRFLIGIRLLTGTISGARAAHAFSDLADLTIDAALKAVMTEVEAAHGRFPGGRVAVVGMGKLGSREMTAGSDIDLILLYDVDDEAFESDGEKPIDANRYYTRLTQRLIAAMSAPTAQGVLYEVDMRLRPSGNKGPVATRINAFEKYQREDAWTWEHMALTRARMICGDQSLIDEADGIIAEVIAAKRERKSVAHDVAEMRALIDKEKPPSGIFDFKKIPGGLIDLEFIAQYLALLAGQADRQHTGTAETIARLGAGTLRPDDLQAALSSFELFSALSQIIRMCIDGDLDPADTPAGLADILCQVAGTPDLKSLEYEIKSRAKVIRAILNSLTAR